MAERTYTLFMHDGSQRPPAFEFCVCESPEEARRLALKLLAERPRYTSIEVSDAITSFHVERP